MHGIQQQILGFPIGDERAYRGPVTIPLVGTIAYTDARFADRFIINANANFTLANPTGMYHGQQLIWEILQDATGSRTITLGTIFALGTDITAVTLTTTASKRDLLTGIYNAISGKIYIVGFIKGY